MTKAIKKITKDRNQIYDWIRGLASIAIVLGHFKPFDISKCYFQWSIHAFVLVTLALAASSSFNFSKFCRRFAYLAFVYATLAFCFWMIHSYQKGVHGAPHQLLLAAFFKNPYFDQLWYFILYAQILIMLLFFSKKFNNLPPGKTILVSLIISQTTFLATYFGLQTFTTISIPSWFFVMSIGWFIMPNFLKKIKDAANKRPLRIIAAFVALCFFFVQPWFREWSQISETRTFILNTLVFFTVIYFLAEFFYFIKNYSFFQPIIKSVCFISKYTLVLYIYHQGVRQIVHPTGIDALWWSLFSIATGVLVGHLIHNAYLILEQWIHPWDKPKPSGPIAYETLWPEEKSQPGPEIQKSKTPIQ